MNHDDTKDTEDTTKDEGYWPSLFFPILSSLCAFAPWREIYSKIVSRATTR